MVIDATNRLLNFTYQLWFSEEPKSTKSRRWLHLAFVFVISVILHVNTLRGTFVWDDRPAVLDNPDVRTDAPWRDMWRHDFWGQEMGDPESHKSYRPLTTLTYRLDNLLEGAGISMPLLGQDFACTGGSVSDGEDDTDTQALATASGPDQHCAFRYHMTNVLIHAATCVEVLLLFRVVFVGQELPALISSLMFTSHPVHVEAVAPLVGRADLLCGFLSVLALLLAFPIKHASHLSTKPRQEQSGLEARVKARDRDRGRGKKGPTDTHNSSKSGTTTTDRKGGGPGGKD